MISSLCFEHDLFEKPVSTHRVVARGHAFPDHALVAPPFTPNIGKRQEGLSDYG
jgi:hypothetical protein